MLSQFQASYQRLEQSLQRLTDSIAAYNPSPSAADELLAADDAVNQDLDQLIVHQNNYTRIQELRRTAEALDERIRTTIRTLADARREIQAIPTARIDSDEPVPREINVEELLSYAKFISRTTVPPTFRQQDVPPFPTKLQSAVANGTTSTSQPGVSTPTATAQDGATPTANAATTTAAGGAVKAEDNQVQEWLDQKLPFEPWPSQAQIQMGVLGNIQRLIESGRDPASVLTAEEQIEADQRKKEAEERERLAREEAERRRASMFDTGSMRRRETMGDIFNPDDL